MAVFDFEAIKSHEEIGPVSHKRNIGTLHCKSDHAARLRMKYEMMHLAHTLGGLSLLPRLVNRHTAKLADKIFAFLHRAFLSHKSRRYKERR